MREHEKLRAKFLWRYFNLDGDAIFIKYISLVEPMIEPLLVMSALFAGLSTQNIKPPTETPEHQADCKSRYKENMNM